MSADEAIEPSAAVIAAWVQLMRAQKRALRGIEADLKGAGFPPLGWYDVLLELRKAGDAGLRPVELEGRVLLEQHNISRLLDRLETAGYVERRPCPGDRRGQMVALTGDGRTLLQRMWPAYRAAIARHVGTRLGGDRDAAALAALLERLATLEP